MTTEKLSKEKDLRSVTLFCTSFRTKPLMMKSDIACFFNKVTNYFEVHTGINYEDFW